MSPIALCDRVAISLDAGIDLRRIWRSEAERLAGRGARACSEVTDAIQRGDSIDKAIAEAGPFFPPLMVELVRVGDQTGTADQVFHRLAQHYQRQVSRAREFRGAILWPVIQLVLALGIVGVLIALGGMLTDGKGQPLDLKGTIDLAVDVGASVATFHMGGYHPGLSRDDEWKRTVAAIQDAVAYGDARHVSLAVDGIWLTWIVDSLDSLERLFDDVGGKTFGVNFDPSYLTLLGYDAVKFIARFKNRIRHVHLKDHRVTGSRVQPRPWPPSFWV